MLKKKRKDTILLISWGLNRRGVCCPRAVACPVKLSLCGDGQKKEAGQTHTNASVEILNRPPAGVELKMGDHHLTIGNKDALNQKCKWLHLFLKGSPLLKWYSLFLYTWACSVYRFHLHVLCISLKKCNCGFLLNHCSQTAYVIWIKAGTEIKLKCGHDKF